MEDVIHMTDPNPPLSADTEARLRALSDRLRLHAHDLVNGGTNASDLRNDLNEAAAALLAVGRGQQLPQPQFYRVPREAISTVPPMRYELHGLQGDYQTVGLICVGCRGVYPHHEPNCADLYAKRYGEFQDLLEAAEKWKARALKAENAGGRGLPPSREVWLVEHLDKGHGIKRRARYDECSCGATFWRDGSTALQPEARHHEGSSSEIRSSVPVVGQMLPDVAAHQSAESRPRLAEKSPDVPTPTLATEGAEVGVPIPPQGQTCESECNPYVADCGARFCSYEAMAEHNRLHPSLLHPEREP